MVRIIKEEDDHGITTGCSNKTAEAVAVGLTN
jgi:hypothetical protein